MTACSACKYRCRILYLTPASSHYGYSDTVLTFFRLKFVNSLTVLILEQFERSRSQHDGTAVRSGTHKAMIAPPPLHACLPQLRACYYRSVGLIWANQLTRPRPPTTRRSTVAPFCSLLLSLSDNRLQLFRPILRFRLCVRVTFDGLATHTPLPPLTLHAGH